jgi:hypothetical protein
MTNPFTFSELAAGEAFCNREKELKELSSHAANKANEKRLFTAISNEPTANPFSVKYMYNHNLGSYGGVQGAFKKLLDLDYVEKEADGRYFVVDPVFAKWHAQRC